MPWAGKEDDVRFATRARLVAHPVVHDRWGREISHGKVMRARTPDQGGSTFHGD